MLLRQETQRFVYTLGWFTWADTVRLRQGIAHQSPFLIKDGDAVFSCTGLACQSKPEGRRLVGDIGIEPMAYSTSKSRSTTELIAHAYIFKSLLVVLPDFSP